MEFDVKKYFPKKEGFGETAISVPDLEFRASCAEAKFHTMAVERNAAYDMLSEAQSRIAELEAEVERLRHELDACTTSPGGCGYWRDAAHIREAERDTERNDALQDASDVEMIFNAMMSVHDMDVTLVDYAKAVSEAILAIKRT